MAALPGLYLSVVIALTYLRRNRVQAKLAETYGVSQPTADELDPRDQLIADGTLLPCWSWARHQELYSGKHKTTGMNVQVACTLSGNLAWISDALPAAGMTPGA